MRVYCNLCGTQIDAKEFIEDHAVICKACAKKTIKEIMDSTQKSFEEDERYAFDTAKQVCVNLKLREEFADYVLEIIKCVVRDNLHPKNDAVRIVNTVGLNERMVDMIPRIVENWESQNDI